MYFILLLENVYNCNWVRLDVLSICNGVFIILYFLKLLIRHQADTMGLSETPSTGQRKMKLMEGETTIIYSGRDDDNRRERVGILMS